MVEKGLSRERIFEKRGFVFGEVFHINLCDRSELIK